MVNGRAKAVPLQQASGNHDVAQILRVTLADQFVSIGCHYHFLLPGQQYPDRLNELLRQIHLRKRSCSKFL
jgi:hypothetical protein